MRGLRIPRFWSVVATLIVVYALIKWGIPVASREITTLPFPLPVPGTLTFIYMALAVAALFLLTTFSDDYLEEFLHPIRRFLRGEYTKAFRAVGLIAIPLVAGWQVYDLTVPKFEVPAALRIQHPSSNFPKSFEGLENPFANPSEADVAAFVEQARADEVAFIPQVEGDIERWVEEIGPEHTLEFFPTPAMKKLLAELADDQVGDDTARAALVEKNLFEGRALYAMNCRPCHGDSVAGDGTDPWPTASSCGRSTSRTTAPSRPSSRATPSGAWPTAASACPPRRRRGTRRCPNGS
jgi:hypothetical protein